MTVVTSPLTSVADSLEDSLGEVEPLPQLTKGEAMSTAKATVVAVGCR
jgi:hypothetical protein